METTLSMEPISLTPTPCLQRAYITLPVDILFSELFVSTIHQRLRFIKRRIFHHLCSYLFEVADKLAVSMGGGNVIKLRVSVVQHNQKLNFALHNIFLPNNVQKLTTVNLDLFPSFHQSQSLLWAVALLVREYSNTNTISSRVGSQLPIGESTR
jgi:hypothetical protein